MPTIRSHLALFGALSCLIASLALSGVAAATTLPPGVHADPGSPAAKEYSIPLSTARGQAAGSSASGKLFGAGITKGPSAPVKVLHPSSGSGVLWMLLVGVLVLGLGGVGGLALGRNRRRTVGPGLH